MLLCGWSCETDRGASRAHAVSAGDSLRVVVAADAPADLVIGGERYGYYCDLLRAYCDSTGVVLSLVRDAGGSGAEASLRTVPSVTTMPMPFFTASRVEPLISMELTGSGS